jgi:hypothetical protein
LYTAIRVHLLTANIMIHEDIFIRHAEDGMAFVFTVRKGALVVDRGTIPIAGEQVAPGYYGGSETMD